MNTSYVIEGETFNLMDGLAENETAPGSATKNKLSIFGGPEYGDLDKDGDVDAFLILVNESGGSGTFYYAAIAANVDGEYKGTDSVLLGDRIAPQNFSIENGKALVNYVVRNFGEDFSVQPSVGKSLYLMLDPETLKIIEIANDFEGEANPEVMTLNMQTWKWIKTSYKNGEEVTPNKADAFTLSFGPENVSITTDCNTISGPYEANKGQIIFGSNMITTLMFCEDSQEQDFAAMLLEAQTYSFTSKGELVLGLKLDTGSVIFR